jgi:hypothetical protein
MISSTRITVLDGSPAASRRGLGLASSTHVWLGASSGRAASITLPPKLCPAIAATPPISSTSARTSAAHAAIVCGGAPGSERPCWRRSISTTPHSGRRSISLRAMLRQLLPAP